MIQILISTMFLKNPIVLLTKLNVQTEAIIIDQCDYNGEEKLYFNGKEVLIKHTTERGISKSRNMALNCATADIIVFCDDDFIYEDHYYETIMNAYNQFTEADLIVFSAIRNDSFHYTKFPDGRLSKRNKFRVNSIRITAKRKSLKDKNVRFDEHFGPGSEVAHGEDTIFMCDCYKNNLKVYSKNSLLCHGELISRESTWFSGYDKKFFFDNGIIYKRISKVPFLLILYFAIKKHKLYKKQCEFNKAIKFMVEGTRMHLK